MVFAFDNNPDNKQVWCHPVWMELQFLDYNRHRLPCAFLFRLYMTFDISPFGFPILFEFFKRKCTGSSFAPLDYDPNSHKLKSSWFALLITIPTIDWSGAIWFKWIFRFLVTIGTGYLMHFSFVSIRHILFSPYYVRILRTLK